MDKKAAAAISRSKELDNINESITAAANSGQCCINHVILFHQNTKDLQKREFVLTYDSQSETYKIYWGE
jgi:hypothetical protein